jgi:uncharacterized protein (UPF0333 family)
VIEKDNIQELFSKAFENQSAPVRPELWAGVQSKMAAAGVAGATSAAKGISVVAKWILGSAAIGVAGVITTLAVLNTSTSEETTKIQRNTIPVISKKTTIEIQPINNQPNEKKTTNFDVPTTTKTRFTDDLSSLDPVAAHINRSSSQTEFVATIVQEEKKTEQSIYLNSRLG